LGGLGKALANTLGKLGANSILVDLPGTYLARFYFKKGKMKT
jgi:uncharacterized protein (DUF3820 family)